MNVWYNTKIIILPDMYPIAITLANLLVYVNSSWFDNVS